jgi:hypothetical protein
MATRGRPEESIQVSWLFRAEESNLLAGGVFPGSGFTGRVWFFFVTVSVRLWAWHNDICTGTKSIHKEYRENLFISYCAPLGVVSYSHSMVAGGLLLISYTTRLIPFTLFMISFEISARKVYGKCAQSAVMPSTEVTARRATVNS